MKLIYTTRLLLLLLFLMLSLTNCEDEVPSYDLADEKFVEILTDIHVSESAAQHLSLTMRDSMVKVYLDQILEIHEVKKDRFTKNYTQLKKDPAKLQVVYAKVLENMQELKEKELDKKK